GTAAPRGEREGCPVGRRRLGRDAEEWEKRARRAQGERAGGAPAADKARRHATLRSRLENAADTHLGDTNAPEALRVLEEALRRYNAHELEFTGTIDNAIERLAQKSEKAEAEIQELDATLIVAQAPL